MAELTVSRLVGLLLVLGGVMHLIGVLFLGGMIWFHWPSSSVWAIGILVGMILLMTGMTRLIFALTARKLNRLAARQFTNVQFLAG
jgi:uncharacterized membrane protein HdeD (DUF308 family)